jgi:hypothetical protein
MQFSTMARRAGWVGRNITLRGECRVPQKSAGQFQFVCLVCFAVENLLLPAQVKHSTGGNRANRDNPTPFSPFSSVQKCLGKAEALQNNLDGDVKRLTNFTPEYRLRVGNYRILFEVEGAAVVV